MTHLPRESATSTLARIGLPLLALAAVLLALGAVVFAHSRAGDHGDGSEMASAMSDLDQRLAAHRDRLANLSELDLASRLEERRAAEAAAAAEPAKPPVTTSRPPVHNPPVSTQDEDDDHGVITLDCDIDSPLGCMDQ